MAAGVDGALDDRHRSGADGLRERGGARTAGLSEALIPAAALERTGLARAGFTTRLGGVSREPYRSLNLSPAVGDDPRAVASNRERLAGFLGARPERVAEAEQVHGSRLALVERPASGVPTTRPVAGGPPIPGVDGLLTAEPGLWLVIYAADCVPVLLLDPDAPAVAAVHAGWRGTAAGIVPAAVEQLRHRFAADPQHLLAALGPAIGGCCYEVDDVVARAMNREPWWAGAARPTAPGRWHLDLRAAVRAQLRDAGVRGDRITAVGGCTSCGAGLFFSYRRDGVTGRMAGYVALADGGPARNPATTVE